MRTPAIVLLALGLAACASTPGHSGSCRNPQSSNDFFGDPPLEFSGGLFKAFADIGEPSLYCDLRGVTAWRYSYEGIIHPSVTIRATSDGRAYKIYVTRFTTLKDGMHFRAVRRSQYNITADDWAAIEAAAAANDFWNRPRELSSDSNVVILHQPTHVLEGRAETYHVVEVYLSSELTKLEETLKRLARVDD